MPRSPETMARVGMMLYGPHWKLPLADVLDVSTVTMNRWANGKRPIPDTVWKELRSLCTIRGMELAQLAVECAPRL